MRTQNPVPCLGKFLPCGARGQFQREAAATAAAESLQSCPTLCDPIENPINGRIMVSSPPTSGVKILKWHYSLIKNGGC